VKTTFRMAAALAAAAVSVAAFAAPAAAAPARAKPTATQAQAKLAAAEELAKLAATNDLVRLNALPNEPTVVTCPSDAADGYWVHLYWPASAHHAPTCVGGASVNAYFFNNGNGIKFAAICGGNNSGWYAPLDQGSVSFGPGQTKRTLNTTIVGIILSGDDGLPFMCPNS
jgi:hypothetical protein